MRSLQKEGVKHNQELNRLDVDGGSRFSVSILRNSHVACPYCYNIPISHVEFTKWPFSMSP